MPTLMLRSRRVAVLVVLAVVGACGGDGESDVRTPRSSTTSSSTSTSTSTTAAPTTTVAPPRATTAPWPATPTTRRVVTPPPPPPAAPPRTPIVPTEGPRATVEATVRFSGNGHGWAAYLNLHDANSNAVAMGAQSDTGDPPSGGQPTLHANYVIAGRFDHAYGSRRMPAGETHRWALRYYEGAGKAIFFQDGAALLEVPIRLVGRVFYQTEVNVKVDGNSVDATFDDVRVGGTKPGGAAVVPNGQWNTNDFDFYGLDMQQTNAASVVQGARMRGVGTASGLNGKDWHTAPNPVGAIGMITEQ